MGKWISPVFDRTISDVSFAIAKINEWKQTGSKEVYELKGCLNVTDINRIENNIQYLFDELSSLYYFPRTVSKSWDMEKLPTSDDISRIINNVKKTISAYFQTDTAPKVPKTMLTYEQVNDIEENLYLIKEILDDMASYFRECGTFNCGEE